MYWVKCWIAASNGIQTPFVLLSSLLTNIIGKGMTPLIPPPLNGVIVSLLFLYKDCYGIKLSKKVDMLLNKETETMFVCFFLVFNL